MSAHQRRWPNDPRILKDLHKGKGAAVGAT
jgi:hypothetical protein